MKKVIYILLGLVLLFLMMGCVTFVGEAPPGQIGQPEGIEPADIEAMGFLLVTFLLLFCT